MPDSFKGKIVWIVLLVGAVLLGGLTRFNAVERLPIDYDELVYLPKAFRYRQMMNEGRWSDILSYRENLEHPPLVKLIYATDLKATGAREPTWSELSVPQTIRPQDRPAFWGTRKISAVAGILQVLVASIVHPLAGLLLALNTYHIKYSAQVYLEALPGLMAVLAVWLAERYAQGQSGGGGDSKGRMLLLLASAAAVGLAASGKYVYGLTGFILLPYLTIRVRKVKPVLIFGLVAIVAFLITDPYLWLNPPGRLWESLTFHWGYSQSDHVKSSGMPWWAPVGHIVYPAPMDWHAGVFPTGAADFALLPLALVGLPWAVRKRPVWVAWAVLGLVFLFFWPTKWPQYILLVLPPLAVMAGLGLEQIVYLWGRGWAKG